MPFGLGSLDQAYRKKYSGSAMMRPFPSEPSRLALIRKWITARLGATMLVVAGVGILVWTAFRSPQPTPGELALLALFASAFNVWGGAQFASIGKADPKHARSAVRRLYALGRSLYLASIDLQESVAGEDQQKVRESVQVFVSQVEAARLHLLDAIDDWDDVHPDALRAVLMRQRTAERAREGVTDDRGSGSPDTE